MGRHHLVLGDSHDDLGGSYRIACRSRRAGPVNGASTTVTATPSNPVGYGVIESTDGAINR